MPVMRRTLLYVLVFSFLGVPLAARAQNLPLEFVAVAPCRLLDTRPGNGGGGPIQGGTFETFNLPQLAQAKGCADLSSAVTYSLNVTVVPRAPLGYLTIWPAGQSQPTVSTLNSLDGRVKANASIVAAGANLAVSVFVTDTSDVVLDLDGYFTPAMPSTLGFYPLPPCRVADTRHPNGPLGGPNLAAGVPREFPVLNSVCNIPSSALAYSMNFTAIPRGPLGYLSLWPTGSSQPVVSTLNALTGQVTANAAIVPAGQGGDIEAFVSNDADLVIDINGYFALQSSAGLSLYALPPCRVLDTRQGGSLIVSELTVNEVDQACAPRGAQAYVFNATVVPSGPLGYLTLWPDGQIQPIVSTLNALDGIITSNMAIVPTANGAIAAYPSNPTHLVLDISSYFASVNPVIQNPASLPTGTVGQNYPYQLIAVNGFPPYGWFVNSGVLPPGLFLDSTGSISGIPTQLGTYSFTVGVIDSQNHLTVGDLTIIVQ